MKRDETIKKIEDLSRTLEEREREKAAELLAKSLNDGAVVMLRFSVALARVLQTIGVKLDDDGVRTIECLDKLLCQDTLMGNNEMAGKEKDFDMAGLERVMKGSNVNACLPKFDVGRLIRIDKNNETDNKDNM
jgi:hypothetical protein